MRRPTTLLSATWGAVAVVAFVLMASCVVGLCPSNGNSHVIYVTLRGDGGENDVVSVDSNGNYLGGVINWATVPEAIRLAELRAIHQGPDGTLFVAAAKEKYSRIFMLSKHLNVDCTRDYVGSLLEIDKVNNPLMEHPYDFAFSPSNSTFFVSNQNTISVTRYTVDLERGVATPTKPPLQVVQHPGAFITGRNKLGYALLSVRGLAVSPDGRFLVVADVGHSELMVFDAHTGELLWRYRHRVLLPVQILFESDDFFFVTCKVSGVVYRVQLRPNGIVETLVRDAHHRATSGITYDPANRVYIYAGRTDRQLFRFRRDGTSLGSFGEMLPGSPEFLLHLRLDFAPLPACYEMGPLGPRYSVLCVAGWFWVAFGALCAAVWLLFYVRRTVVVPYLANAEKAGV